MASRNRSALAVTHLITTLDLGGAETALYNLVDGRARCRHDVLCLAGLGEYGLRLRQNGISVHALNMTRQWTDILKLPALVRLLKNRQPDALQTWMYHADLLGTAAGVLARIPHIFWNVRCSYIDWRHYAWTTRWIVRLLAAVSSVPHTIVTNSHAAIDLHRRLGYQARRWVVIPNGFDTQRFQPSASAGHGFRVRHQVAGALIGMVARFDPMKDFATFAQAAGILARCRPDVRFVLAGTDVNHHNPKLITLLRDSGVLARCLLLGPRNDLERLYPALDLLTLTSRGEGFPNVLGEAMACGVPCVATDVGDVAHLIGNAGRVVPAGRPDAIAQAWRQMLALTPHQRTAMGMRARRRICSQFSIGSMLARYEQLYQAISGKRV